MAEGTLSLLHEDGSFEPLAVERWLAAATHEDLEQSNCCLRRGACL